MRSLKTSGLGLIFESTTPSPLLATLLVLFMVQTHADTGLESWVQRYSGQTNADDIAVAVAVDGNGNVIVSGYSWNGSSDDFVTIKYSSSGITLWTRSYDGPEHNDDDPVALALDATGNVIVTGNSYDGNFSYFVTIKYSTGGTPRWTNYYHGLGDGDEFAQAIAADTNGTAFVSGTSYGGETFDDYATIAYSSAGPALWTNRYNGPGNGDDAGRAIAVDGNGHVFVTGFSWDGTSDDIATIAYSTAGVPLWTNYYDGPGNGHDEPLAMAVDTNGNVFVAGYSWNGSSDDYVTIAYSSAGAALWTNRYDGPFNTDDYAQAVAVDGSGDVFVTGRSDVTSSSSDFVTIKYSSAGVPLWTNRYTGPGIQFDNATAMGVDANGSVFVTGYSYGAGGFADYATIKYSNAGIPLWTNRYDGPGAGTDESYSLAIGPGGAVYVTGASSDTNQYDFATVKYISGPKIQPLALAGTTNLIVTWTAVPGQSYQLQCSTNLSTTNWQAVTNIVAIDPTVSVNVTPASGVFYRVAQP